MFHSPFFRVAAISPKVRVADVDFNIHQIISAVELINREKVDIAVFPELCVTGYTCGDLFMTETLIEQAWKGVQEIARKTKDIDSVFIIGAPILKNGRLFNCALLLHAGEVKMTVEKKHIPNYNEFYEKRWFSPSIEKPELFQLKGVNIGIEICEDLWTPNPPSVNLCQAGADIIFNLSASNDTTGKYEYLLELIKHQSAACICGYVYASAGFGESSSDLVFDGKTIIVENGHILEQNHRWNNDLSLVIADLDIEAIRHDRIVRNSFHDGNEEAVDVIIAEKPGHERNSKDILRKVNPLPFVPSDFVMRQQRCNEIINIQAAGLSQRLDAIKCRNLVVGLSGGLDSTLALLVACKAFDRLGLDKKGILAVTMPGFGTTSRTENNAEKLAELAGVSLKKISIVTAVNQHFEDIGHDSSVHDVTYENSQARIRTLILMDLANKMNGLVLGTGDLSELALGWATYNGDHMSMYSVNSGVPKTLVRYLIKSFAEDNDVDKSLREVLNDIADTPVSPELLPPTEKGEISQITEDLVGPYELHDFFLYHFLRFGASPEKILSLALIAFKEKFDQDIILHWMKVFFKRFFAQQFKRSCMPDGPKVGSICLSPRGDWRMPSDASSREWIELIDKLIEETKK